MMHGLSRREVVCVASSLFLASAAVARAESPGTVLSHVKLGNGTGGFAGVLEAGDEFGVAVASLGDVDGDGVPDLAVGSRADDDGGPDRGAVWVLFLNTDGTVRAHQKISAGAGGFTGRLDRSDRFGVSLAALGDLDGDGVVDMAVGASGDDDGSTNRGAVWVLFLNTNGTVKAYQKISSTQGGFFGRLGRSDLFGASVTSVGDLNGDGVVDVAVGAPFDDDGGTDHGAVWLLFLRTNGTVQSFRKISDTQGLFTGTLARIDWFGESVANMNDLAGYGLIDLAVGARGDDAGGSGHGAVWMVFLNADGTVKTHQKISGTEGGFAGALDTSDYFGISVIRLDDLDADGVDELAVGAFFDDDGGLDRGAVWVLLLNRDGTVRAHQKISATDGGFTGPLSNGDWFGSALGFVGDLDGDGSIDLAVGARRDGGTGATWMLSLSGAPPVNECPPDLDGDGFVTGEDLALLMAAWGPCSGCREDLDGDGQVAFSDVLIALRAWGSCEGEGATDLWDSKRSIRESLQSKDHWKIVKKGLKQVRREEKRQRHLERHEEKSLRHRERHGGKSLRHRERDEEKRLRNLERHEERRLRDLERLKKLSRGKH